MHNRKKMLICETSKIYTNSHFENNTILVIYICGIIKGAPNNKEEPHKLLNVTTHDS